MSAPLFTVADAAVLDQVRGLGWPARRRSRRALAGSHPSRLLGPSTAEFVEYRGYRQGDDPRRIDWKLLARTNRVYLRLAQERTLVPTLFVVDASASLAFPTPSLAKWALSRHLTLGLAAVARHVGDPVGLVVAHPTGPRPVAPSARRSVLEAMLQALAVTPAGQPSLAAAVQAGRRQAARLVLISDFLEETEALLAVGRTLVAAGGECYALHVVAQEELDPDPAQRLVEDPEAPAVVRRPLMPTTRATYQARFAAWRAHLAREWRQAGAVYAMVVPGAESLRHAVRRITAAGINIGTR